VNAAKTEVTIANGATVVCTITNTAIFPKLTLVKRVNNGDTGGLGTIGDWLLTADGPTSVTGHSTDASVTDVSVRVGTYKLSESAGLPGYTNTGWDCTGTGVQSGANITLAEGQSAVCTIINTAQPAQWTVTKSSDPASGTTVKPGDTINYTITVAHTAGIVPANLVIHDDLSQVLPYASMGTIAAPHGSTAVVSGTDLAWTISSFGSELALRYAVTVNAGADGIELKNVVTVPEGGTCVGTCSTSNPTPHWTVVKSSDPTSGSLVDVGSTITYTLTAHNDSDAQLAGAIATDDLGDVLDDATLMGTLPAGLTLSADGTTLRWAVPTIEAGGADASVSYTVTVKPDAFGETLRNHVTPDAAGDCVASGDDDAPNCTTDHRVRDVDTAIVKTHTALDGGAVRAGVGDEIDYTLAVTNNGKDAATQVIVSDPLPSGLTIKDGSIEAPAGWDTSASTATKLVATFAGPFGIADSARITFTVIVGDLAVTGDDTLPTIDNVACIAQAETDSDQSDNCSTDVTNVAEPELPTLALEEPPGSSLPFTGTNPDGLIFGGGMLLVFGTLLLLVAARRRREEGGAE
jgi:conserved repeat domain